MQTVKIKMINKQNLSTKIT